MNTTATSISRTTRAAARGHSREQILKSGRELIAGRGFNATGLDAILKAAGVPKGSFYHYFASKEDFGLAVIDDFAQQYAEHLNGFLSDKTLAPLERVRRFMESGIESLGSCQCARGCLLGDLGQELAAQNESFRVRIDRVFQSWKRKFADCFEEARAAGDLHVHSDPDKLAEFFLAGWEGALLRAKVAKSVQPLKDFTELFFAGVLKP